MGVALIPSESNTTEVASASVDVTSAWNSAAATILAILLFMIGGLSLLANTAHLFDPGSKPEIRERLAELSRLHDIHEFLANEVGIGKQPARFQVHRPVMISDEYGDVLRRYDEFWKDFENVYDALSGVSEKAPLVWGSYCEFARNNKYATVGEYEAEVKNRSENPTSSRSELVSPQVLTEREFKRGDLHSNNSTDLLERESERDITEPAAEILLILGETRSAAKRAGVIGRSFQESTLANIAFTASISDRKLVFIRLLKSDMKTFQNTWMCAYAGDARWFLSEKDGDRIKLDGNFGDFGRALQVDGENNPYAGLTVAQYQDYEQKRLADLKQMISGIANTTTLSIKEWMPALAWRDWLSLSPWVVTGGYILCAIALSYLRGRLGVAQAELKGGGADVAGLLTLPQPFGGRTSRAAEALSIVFGMIPLALLLVMVAMQAINATQIANIVPTKELGGLLFVEDEYYRTGAAGVEQVMRPDTFELIGCVVACGATFAYIALRRAAIRRGTSIS